MGFKKIKEKSQKINWAIIVGVGLVLGFLVWLWEDIKSILKFEPIKEPILGNGLEKLSEMSEGLALNVADRLHVSMNKLGTEDTEVHHIMDNLTQPEFEHVYVKFGKRSYSQWRGYGTLWSFNGVSKNENLGTWLRSEFSDEPNVIERWRTIFNQTSF